MRAWLMAALVGLAAFPADALAFGGAYVGGDGVTATNRFGHVVITRLGTTSVVTLAPDVTVDAAEFGMVLPIPSAIDAEDVDTVDPNLLVALDEYSAPKLLSYTCEDLYPWGGEDTGWDGYDYYDYYYYDWYEENQRERPLFGRNWGEGACGQCGPVGCGNTRIEQPGRGYYGYDYDYAWGDTAQDTDTDTGSTPEVVGVAVEDEFVTNGVYEITVLTAEESAALVEWLGLEGFAVGSEAEAAFQEYVDLGWRFVVAKVTLEGVPDDGGLLPPLQLTYTSEALTLPLRLGTVNADGAQDVVVQVLNDASLGRASVVNYDKKLITDECMHPEEVASFDGFYEGYADDMLEVGTQQDTDGEPIIMGWAHEFSRPAGSCDPCGPRGPLVTSVARAFGWDLSVDSVHVTRMRLHYNERGLDQDPVIGNQGVAGALSLEYVAWREELESDFEICGEGWTPDPGSCVETRERRRTNRRLPLQGSLAGTGLLLAAAYAWRRNVSRR